MSPSSEQNGPNTILLLDDEFDIVNVFKQGLERRGFQVFAFTDPLIALEHFYTNSKKYGLVISDLRMPRMNGYEFIKRVKEIKADVKVFFMTAFEIDHIDFRRVLPSIKIDEFIRKPISLEDLSGVLRKYITIEIKSRP